MKKIILFLLLIPVVYGYYVVEIPDQDFVNSFDLSRINKIQFLTKESEFNGYTFCFGYWCQIYLYNMPRDDWKVTFRHEYGHVDCYTKNRDMSEQCADDFTMYKE